MAKISSILQEIVKELSVEIDTYLSLEIGSYVSQNLNLHSEAQVFLRQSA